MEPADKQDINKQNFDNVNVGLLIGILVSAAFVVILNETTLVVALPVLMKEFSIAAGPAQWLITAFMLTMAVVIPMTGYIMQRFTLRSIYIFALSTFLVGTIVATGAPTFPILLIARVIQATGTALIMPLLMTTIMRLVPVERRGSVFGMVTLVIAVAPALGPTFSGVVMDYLNWRWVFGLVVPLVLIMLLFGIWQVRNFEEPTRPFLDFISVILSAIGFSATIYGVAGMSDLPLGVPWDRVAFLAVGVIVLVVFFKRQLTLERGEEASGKSPVLNLAPLRNREYVLSLALLLLSFSMLFGFIILMPMYAQDVVGLGTLATGLVSLPGGILMGVMGTPVGRAYDRFGARPLIIPGTILLLLSMIGFATLENTERWIASVGNSASWLSFLSNNPALWQLMFLTVLLNLGIGFMLTPLMSNALASVPDDLASHGQAILNTFQQVAGGAGTAIFVAVMSFGSARMVTSKVAEGGDPQQLAQSSEVLSHGIEVAFWFGVAVSVLAVIFAVAVRIEARPEHAEVHEQVLDEKAEN